MAASVVTETAKYVVFPLLAPAVGGLIALRFRLSEQVKSLVKHVAAGLVFAAAAIELLPNLLNHRHPLAVIVGFLLGLLLLLGVNRVFGGHYHGDKDETSDHQHTDDESSASVSTMMAAIGIDVAVDGLLIGIGFATGLKGGRLLTLALSTEALFIGLSIFASCRQRHFSNTKSFSLTIAPGIILAVMALVGATIMSSLHGGMRQGVLAFGLSALLYLVTEELLVEAHEQPDEPVEVVGFFVGFLLILALAIL